MALRLPSFIRTFGTFGVRAMSTGEAGSGAGKGGGTGGSIRDAGGSFGKMEAAHEEQYMRKLAQEQLKHLKDHHDEKEIRQHEVSLFIPELSFINMYHERTLQSTRIANRSHQQGLVILTGDSVSQLDQRQLFTPSIVTDFDQR
ncbi:ATPase inhibitor B, mitochondrial-like [Argopecten irradians]|uniref:ATPase inhibitor B, mitochondrial-like n=1 Tax=Argopecten irradians TaxID=31199 RepID=UPI00371DAD49